MPIILTKLIAGEELIYHTNFELNQGYNIEYTLQGQENWQVEGSAGNGLLEGYFNDYGEFGNQAYVGAFVPENTDEQFLIAWPKIQGLSNFDKKFRCTVVMMIVDSEDDNRDYFQWTIFNKKEKPLLTIDFDNNTKEINYILGKDGQVFYTGFTFENNQLYELDITVDLKYRLWSVSIGGESIVNNGAINLPDQELSFGDFDAVWHFNTIGSPGNNFMVFDDYKIYADRSTPKYSDFEIEKLYNAIKDNKINLVKQFLNNGLSPNNRLGGWTLLTHAVFNNNIDVVNLLIDLNVNVNLWNSKGKSPLALACDMNYLTIGKVLINNGADLEYKYPDGENLLTVTSREGYLGFVKMLLNEGPELNVDFKNEKEQSGLHMASYKGNEDIAFYLLSKGADINLKDSTNRSPIDYCLLGSYMDLAVKFKNHLNLVVVYQKENIQSDKFSKIKLKVNTLIPGRYLFGYNVPVRNIGLLYTSDLKNWEVFNELQPNTKGFNEFTVTISKELNRKEFFRPSFR